MRRRNFDIRIQIEAGVHFFGTQKLFRRDYLDYLKLLANLGIITYPNSYHDLQLRAKCRKIDPATGVIPLAEPLLYSKEE